MEIEIPVELYSLSRSLTPSFISCLYQKKRDKIWVKVAGYLKGLKLQQPSPNMVIASFPTKISEEELQREALLETGLCHEAFEKNISKMPNGIRESVGRLAQHYFGVRIPVSPRDFVHILVAVALSKRTDYERFVLKWCEKIWQRFDQKWNKLVSASSQELKRIGTSYQISMMIRTLQSFEGIPQRLDALPNKIKAKLPEYEGSLEGFLLRMNPELTRLVLINLCWGLGPKTVDSIILSTFVNATHFIPCDVHLQTVTSRLGIIHKNSVLPRKALCQRYACNEKLSSLLEIPACPLEKACLRNQLAHLGAAGGWFQTLIYLHGRCYCYTKNPRCYRCPLRRLCGR